MLVDQLEGISRFSFQHTIDNSAAQGHDSFNIGSSDLGDVVELFAGRSVSRVVASVKLFVVLLVMVLIVMVLVVVVIMVFLVVVIIVVFLVVIFGLVHVFLMVLLVIVVIMVFLMVVIIVVLLVVDILLHVGHGELELFVGDSVLRGKFVNKVHGVGTALGCFHNGSVKSKDGFNVGSGDLSELVQIFLRWTLIVMLVLSFVVVSVSLFEMVSLLLDPVAFLVVVVAVLLVHVDSLSPKIEMAKLIL